VKNDWKELCTAANIENARVHDLRHTFASHLVSSGVPVATVGRLLGHTQSQTTKRYAHFAESPLREAANRFGKLIASKRKAAREK
jgi:site-specific recombinase XerD